MDPQGGQREEDNNLTAGFGFFPPVVMLLATYNFTSGDSGHAPLDVVTFRHIWISTGALVLLLIFLSLIL
jgi:hypothetical protein